MHRSFAVDDPHASGRGPFEDRQERERRVRTQPFPDTRPQVPGVVGRHGLDEDVDRAAAAESEPPDLPRGLLGLVVADAREARPRGREAHEPDVLFEAAPAHAAERRPAVGHEQLRARTAIRGTFDVNHSGNRYRSSLADELQEGVEDPLGLLPVFHGIPAKTA